LALFFQNYIEQKIQKESREYEEGFIYTNKKMEVIGGAVSKFPRYTHTNNQYIISIPHSNTNVLVYTHPYQKFSYLDYVEISGSLQDIREQDQKWYSYYQKLEVQYILWYPSISSVQKQTTVNIFQKILKHIFVFKTHIREKVLEKFSSHTSALVLGMLLGEKDELSKEEKEMFNTASLSHILVVSGYNISLVISFVFILLQSFPRYIKTVSALIFIFLFVLMVGFDASIIRSALMGSIIIIGKICNKKSSGVHTLILVATCMLIHNPFIVFDAGFHLSFLATYSLLILPNFKKVPEYITTTVWVFMWVSLYVLYLSQSTSFIGIFTNLLVLIFVPVFMGVAGISILLSFLNIKVLFDVFVLEILSRYIFLIAKISIYVPKIIYEISPQLCAGIYVLVLSSICFNQNKYTTKEFILKHYQKFVPQQSN
jgi:competence protein ComEC